MADRTSGFKAEFRAGSGPGRPPGLIRNDTVATGSARNYIYAARVEACLCVGKRVGGDGTVCLTRAGQDIRGQGRRVGLSA